MKQSLDASFTSLQSAFVRRMWRCGAVFIQDVRLGVHKMLPDAPLFPFRFDTDALALQISHRPTYSIFLPIDCTDDNYRIIMNPFSVHEGFAESTYEMHVVTGQQIVLADIVLPHGLVVETYLKSRNLRPEQVEIHTIIDCSLGDFKWAAYPFLRGVARPMMTCMEFISLSRANDFLSSEEFKRVVGQYLSLIQHIANQYATAQQAVSF